MEMMSFVQHAKLWSLLTVFVTFGLIVLYAMWPSSKKNFDEAANLPLRED
jgi:cytochrome c oxidase cbb3-type subunit 4